MKYILDNNLPPRLAEAINCLTKPDGIEVIHLKHKFEPSTKDVAWINELAKEGDWVIISQDHFIKNLHEKEALRQTGLITFVLKSAWADLKLWDKSYHLVRWWSRIMEQAEGVKGGAIFAVPINFSGKGQFEQYKL